MNIRQAIISDIPQLQLIRHSVKENILSNPALVTDKDCEEYLTVRGRGWVCEIENEVVGFAIVDLQEHNVWALFLMPEFEGRGIGKALHNTMLNWYFGQTTEALWLGTEFNTRAEQFYRLQGWNEAGKNGPDEVRFEMSFDNWMERLKNQQ